MKTKQIFKTCILLTFAIAVVGCGSNNNDPLPIQEPPPIQFTDNYQELLDIAVGEVIPGLILSIDGPGTNFIGAAGLADIETQTPMQTYNVMPAGSAGKKATALLVNLLHEDGVLNIDDKITTWLPANLLAQIPHSSDMSLRQLLTHTAGVHDYLDADTQQAWFEYGMENLDTLKTDITALGFILNKPAYFAPGEDFKYSNTGYILAGLILDEVLGEHHYRALRNRILIPLGMNDSYYSGLEKYLDASISGYFDDGDEVLNTKTFYDDVGVADAPLVTSVTDMSTLLRAIVSEGSPFSQDVVNNMIADANLTEYSQGKFYGMGIFKETINGMTVYHHGGDEMGYKTTNMYIKEIDTTVTMFANCNGYEACINKTDAIVQSIMMSLF